MTSVAMDPTAVSRAFSPGHITGFVVTKPTAINHNSNNNNQQQQ